jgi:hypothetical protein
MYHHGENHGTERISQRAFLQLAGHQVGWEHCRSLRISALPAQQPAKPAEQKPAATEHQAAPAASGKEVRLLGPGYDPHVERYRRSPKRSRKKTGYKANIQRKPGHRDQAAGRHASAAGRGLRDGHRLAAAVQKAVIGWTMSSTRP